MKHSSSLILDSIFFKVPDLSILEGAFLKVTPGKITAIIGRNGTGKSTLLKIAAGQLQANGGITIINGERIHKKSLQKRFRNIAYLPQSSMLPVELSVNQIINSFPTSKNPGKNPFIKKLLRQKILELSGGERRFFEVSLLLSLDRKYILLDEPFTGVEPYIVDRIIERLKKEAQNGRGILLTDHQHRYVSQVADVSYLLHNKQCYKLNGDLTTELRTIGYIR